MVAALGTVAFVVLIVAFVVLIVAFVVLNFDFHVGAKR